MGRRAWWAWFRPGDSGRPSAFRVTDDMIGFQFSVKPPLQRGKWRPAGVGSRKRFRGPLPPSRREEVGCGPWRLQVGCVGPLAPGQDERVSDHRVLRCGRHRRAPLGREARDGPALASGMFGCLWPPSEGVGAAGHPRRTPRSSTSRRWSALGMEASVAARGGVLQSSREKGRGLCPRRAQTRRGGGGPPAGEWLGRTVTGRVPDDQSGEVKKRCLSAARASGKGGAGERARTPFTGNFITRNLSTQNGRPAGRPRPPRTHHPTDLPHVPVRESPRVVHGSRRGQAPAPGLSLCFSP